MAPESHKTCRFDLHSVAAIVPRDRRHGRLGVRRTAHRRQLPRKAWAGSGCRGRIRAAGARACHDLEVPTPKSYGIDHEAWDRLTPLMAEQAVASGSPANNPVVPSLDEIEKIYDQIYDSRS